MDAGSAAILMRLGLGDRVVGTAAPEFATAFAGDERARLERVPVLDPGAGNVEAVLAARPELVMGVSALSFGGFPGTPTVDRLRQAGTPALVACDAGAVAPVVGIEATSAFVQRTADLFGVPERGRALAASIRARAAAGAPAPGAPRVRVLQVAGAPAAGRPVATRGGASLANGVITLAGGRNVGDDVPHDFATVSAEEITARDPQAIVVVSGISPLPDAELSAAVQASPVLANTTAVREGRIGVIPQSVLSAPSVLNGDAVVALGALLRAPAR